MSEDRLIDDFRALDRPTDVDPGFASALWDVLEREYAGNRRPQRDMRLVVAAAAAVAVIAIGALTIGAIPISGLNVGEPGEALPSAAASPSPTPHYAATPPRRTDCANGAPSCAGTVQAGAWRSLEFQPPFTYEIPEAWGNTMDLPHYFEFYPPGGAFTGRVHIEMWSDPLLTDQASSCEPRPLTGPDGRQPGPEDWVVNVASHPALEATQRPPEDIGGFTAQVIDIRAADAWNADCPVLFIWSVDPAQGPLYGVPDHQPMRLYIVDVRGTTVLVGVYSTEGSGADGDIEAAVMEVEPFLESLQFENPDSFPAESALQRLAPGTQSARTFWPPLTFTVPDGWLTERAAEGWLGLVPDTDENRARTQAGGFPLTFLDVFLNFAVAAEDCEEAAAPGVGLTAGDIVGALATRPGLTTGGPVPVTIGGLSGQQIDLSVAPDWTGTCPQVGTPFVPLVYSSDFIYWGAAPGERFRIVVLDVAGLLSGMHAAVMIVVYSAEEAVWDDHLSASMAVVESFEFDTTPPAP